MAAAANSAPIRSRVICSPPLCRGWADHDRRRSARRRGSAMCGCMILTGRPRARRGSVRRARRLPRACHAEPPRPRDRGAPAPAGHPARRRCSSPAAERPEAGPSQPVGATPRSRRRPRPSATEPPFEPAAWPAAGSACEHGGLRRAAWAGSRRPTPRTVRFTLCAPGRARSRRASPIRRWASSTRASSASSRATRRRSRDVAGAGPFRIEAWTDGDNVRLGADGRCAGAAASPAASAGPPSPRRVSGAGVRASPARRSRRPRSSSAGRASPASRTAALRAAEVDGIDDPVRRGPRGHLHAPRARRAAPARARDRLSRDRGRARARPDAPSAGRSPGPGPRAAGPRRRSRPAPRPRRTWPRARSSGAASARRGTSSTARPAAPLLDDAGFDRDAPGHARRPRRAGPGAPGPGGPRGPLIRDAARRAASA